MGSVGAVYAIRRPCSSYLQRVVVRVELRIVGWLLSVGSSVVICNKV